MSSLKVPALAGLLRQMGYTWATADEVCNAVETLNINGCRSDDLAAALLAWRRAGVNAALSRVRKRAASTLIGDGSTKTVGDVAPFLVAESDFEGQMKLWEALDEKQRLGNFGFEPGKP